MYCMLAIRLCDCFRRSFRVTLFMLHDDFMLPFSMA